MYHGIISSNTDIPPGREAGAELYDVSIDHFRAQMQCLKASGREAALTFDDGEMNNYTLAFPVMKELGLKAYFFIIVKRIGNSGYMDWKQLKSLVDEGMTVGSHGLTHEILTNLKDTQVIEELRASKNCLESNLGIPVTSLSIPRGFCNDKIIQMAYDLGYTQVFISDRPKCSKAVCIPRVAVKAGWSLKRFKQALEGHVPAREIVGNVFKNTAKIVLRESGYNFIRKTLIYIIK